MTGKVVLITGANGGLGAVVTRAFLDAGATVVGTSRRIREDEFTGANFFGIAAELSSREAATALAKTIADRYGRLDAVVHLVGGFAVGTLDETDDKTFSNMIDLNLRSAFLMIAAALPHLRKSGNGRIVAIGSRAAVEPAPGAALYAASKAALVSLIRSLAAESARDGITANVLLPGTIDTPANRATQPQADFTKWVDPQRLAQTCLFLVADGGSNISGAAIPVYGRDV